MKLEKISNVEIEKLSNATRHSFPKYTSQIINYISMTAQATRPKVVGQMSELIKEFNGNSIEEWTSWYNTRFPNAVQEATDKIFAKYLEMREAYNNINRKTIEDWVKDLIYNKTYCGLKLQNAIIAYLANQFNKSWKLAEPNEESKGIDGYIGEIPVQIKSSTYQIEASLPENIDVAIIYYEKKKDGIVISYDPEIFSAL
jgi:hypothetical protein